MFHANTRKVIEGWNARRGDRPAPLRRDISPGTFSDLLPQLFILGRNEELRSESFRLAGGLLTDLHGRDLRGVDFFTLFLGIDRDAVRQALDAARRCGAPVVLEVSGWTAPGDEAKFEITLAPLTGPTGELDRVLGLFQPTSSVRRLMGASIEALTLTDVRLAEHGMSSALVAPSPPPPTMRDRSHLRLVALEGVRLD